MKQKKKRTARHGTELRREQQNATENKSEKLNDLGFLMNSCVIFALILLFSRPIAFVCVGNVSEGVQYSFVFRWPARALMYFSENSRKSWEAKVNRFSLWKPFFLLQSVSLSQYSAPMNANLMWSSQDEVLDDKTWAADDYLKIQTCLAIFNGIEMIKSNLHLRSCIHFVFEFSMGLHWTLFYPHIKTTNI